jgi:hypothetical protein
MERDSQPANPEGNGYSSILPLLRCIMIHYQERKEKKVHHIKSINQIIPTLDKHASLQNQCMKPINP